MTSPAQWRAALLARDPRSWPAYLDEHSGLPGPRANTALATVAAELVDPALADALAASDDEYRAMCGSVALGARAADPATASRLRTLATDGRWRVREGVALGLQRLGDADPGRLRDLVLDWSAAPEPLVRRAAAAAICEPRLLRTPEAAAVAVEVCRRATAQLAAGGPAERRAPDSRTLRQALGYCWSVAVAADPGPGLAAFHDLDEADPDVGWIVAQNRRKRRLARLVEPSGLSVGSRPSSP